jgi:hypothetical protein
LIVVLSLVLFGLAAWWTLMGKIGEGDGFLLFAGCLLSAIVFTFRAQDPAWLDPVSILKR